MSEYERVFTVPDYHDGPLSGIANFRGSPHLFERRFDKAVDEYETVFRLSPVSQEVLVLALESWNIWRRWNDAFKRGQTTADTHPALPVEQERSQELHAILDEALRIDENSVRCAYGFFEETGDYDPAWMRNRAVLVRWEEVPCPP